MGSIFSIFNFANVSIIEYTIYDYVIYDIIKYLSGLLRIKDDLKENYSDFDLNKFINKTYNSIVKK